MDWMLYHNRELKRQNAIKEQAKKDTYDLKMLSIQEQLDDAQAKFEVLILKVRSLQEMIEEKKIL